jgi:3-oxoacyl-[acyl-carrier protein] reductase
MRQNKWGRIINMTSVAAYIGGNVGPHYAASKGAIIGFTNFIAKAYPKEGITCNAVSPALVASDMLTALQVDPNITPVGR